MRRVKRTTLVLIIALAGILGPGFSAPPVLGAEVEIRVADLEKVFEQYIKKIQAEAALKEQAERFNLERQELVKQGQALNDQYNKLRDEAQDPALSDDAREAKQSQAEDLLGQLQEFQQRLKTFDDEKRRLLDEQSKRMRRTLVREIRDEVKKYAEQEGIDLVIDISGNTLNMEPVILYADDRLDITNRLIERLNLPEEVR